jgi:phosphohistidine phosphatase
MELYLLRHGIADAGKPGGTDAARELTDEGRERTAAVLELARRSGAQPSLILSSPYVRARQTAKIAARELGYEGEIVTLDTLAPHGAPEDVWTDLRNHPHEDAILLAGHEPLLSALIAYLLNAPSLRVEMKKAALVRIDVEGMHAVPHGVLRWMLVPRLA